MARLIREDDYLRVEKKVSGLGNQISAINIYSNRIEIERVMTPDKPTVISFDKISYFLISRYFVDNQNYNVILYDEKDNMILDFKLDSEFSDGENNCEETRTLLNAFAQYKLGYDFNEKLDTLDVIIPIKKSNISKSEKLTLKNGVLTFPDGTSEKITDLKDVIFIPDAVLPKIQIIFNDNKQFEIVTTGSHAIILFEALMMKVKGYGIDFSNPDKTNMQKDSFMCRDKLIDDLVFENVAKVKKDIGNMILALKKGNIQKYLEDGESIEEIFVENVNFPSGKLILTDPKSLYQDLPFNKSAPAGSYPVYVYVKNNQDKGEISFVEIRFSQTVPFRYENAFLENSIEGNDVIEIIDSQSDCFAIMDEEIFDYLDSEMDNDFLTFMNESMKVSSKSDYSYCLLEPEDNLHLFIFSNLQQNGSCPAFFGYDFENNICSIVIYMDNMNYQKA